MHDGGNAGEDDGEARKEEDEEEEEEEKQNEEDNNQENYKKKGKGKEKLCDNDDNVDLEKIRITRMKKLMLQKKNQKRPDVHKIVSSIKLGPPPARKVSILRALY